MALAGDQHDIARIGLGEGDVDCLGALGHDARPALDDAQRPVDSFFNAGGLACLFTLALRY